MSAAMQPGNVPESNRVVVAVAVQLGRGMEFISLASSSVLSRRAVRIDRRCLIKQPAFLNVQFRQAARGMRPEHRVSGAP